jgi:AraC-like DNA-binding protein
MQALLAQQPKQHKSSAAQVVAFSEHPSGTASAGPKAQARHEAYVVSRRNGHTPVNLRKVVVPRNILGSCSEHPLLRGLLPTSAGFARPTSITKEASALEAEAAFIYCTKGRGWCELEGKRHEIRAGHLLITPPGARYCCGAIDNDPWMISWVRAVGGNLDFFLTELGVSVQNPVLQVGDDPQLLALFHEVLEALEGASAPPRLLYAAQTLAHLIGTVIWHCRGCARTEPDVWRRIEQSIAYMQQHLDKPLHVSTLATLANVSPSYYTVLFKRQTGSAPIDYFIRLRMQHACHLLEATSFSVKEVAAALGYDDPFYFSRIFKSVNEVAPSWYRQSRKQDSPCKS